MLFWKWTERVTTLCNYFKIGVSGDNDVNFSSFVQWSTTVCRILVDSIMSNISVI